MWNDAKHKSLLMISINGNSDTNKREICTVTSGKIISQVRHENTTKARNFSQTGVK